MRFLPILFFSPYLSYYDYTKTKFTMPGLRYISHLGRGVQEVFLP